MPEMRWTRRAVFAICLAASLVVTWQRGRIGHWHTTLLIFRQSFWHLVAGSNLYAPYPAEQGTAAASLFKYSPTAALLFAPFAVPPYAVALFIWSLLSSLLLCYALLRLLPDRRGVIAVALVLPELFASMQAVSSNALVAALIVLAFIYIESRRLTSAAVAIGVGTAMKVFPAAAIVFALFQPRRRAFVLALVAVAIVLIALPLAVTPPATLVQQYRWWAEIERFDAQDVLFGDSIMRLARSWIGGDWPNWPVQLAGTAVLLLPVALRRDQWASPEFRLRCLASLLVYSLLFNHQAERPSMVIGAAGVAIWYASPAIVTASIPRTVIAVLAVIGLRTPPLVLAWVVMQAEIYSWQFPAERPFGLQAKSRRQLSDVLPL